MADRLLRIARFATLRRAARTAGFAGAAGSILLTIRAGYRLGSPLLVLVLVTGWVLAPFVMFALLDRASKHWSALTRTVLYCMMVIVPLGSLAIYIRFVFGPTRAKPAFAFVAVPPATVLLVAAAIFGAALLSRRSERRGQA